MNHDTLNQDTMLQNAGDTTWAAEMRGLAPGEQADMLAGALRLLNHPDAISTPLESEARIFAEQVHLALGQTLTA